MSIQVQIGPNRYKYVQIGPNESKSVQMGPNRYKQVQQRQRKSTKIKIKNMAMGLTFGLVYVCILHSCWLLSFDISCAYDTLESMTDAA